MKFQMMTIHSMASNKARLEKTFEAKKATHSNLANTHLYSRGIHISPPRLVFML